MPLTDAQVVRRVLAGDVEGFASLVDRYHARCLRVATHLLADGDDAEDAVQDAFVRAFRHLASYRDRDRFGAWIMRIVVNECRTHAARQRRRLDGDLAADSVALLYASDAHDAVDRRMELERALLHLTPNQREAVVLRFTDDLSFDEMSTITGVGVSALKMRVQRACAQLRTLLAERLHA